MIHAPTLQIHKHAPLVLLRAILQPQLPTHLLHPRLDLLHMVATMIPLADNNMQVGLSLLPRGFNPLFEHVFRLLDEQAVQVDGVASHAAGGIVLAENVVARLVVVLRHLGGVLLAFFAELVGAAAVARFVGLVRAVEA